MALCFEPVPDERRLQIAAIERIIEERGDYLSDESETGLAEHLETLWGDHVMSFDEFREKSRRVRRFYKKTNLKNVEVPGHGILRP